MLPTLKSLRRKKKRYVVEIIVKDFGKMYAFNRSNLHEDETFVRNVFRSRVTKARFSMTMKEPWFRGSSAHRFFSHTSSLNKSPLSRRLSKKSLFKE